MKIETLKQITAASERGETSYLELAAGNDSYCRKFVPRERLIVLGGGHISQPVCRIASMLDFAVTVVDDRPMFANYERFPDAENVICETFRKAIQELHIRENDYVCVITRGHQWDGECLREILSGQMPSYLGMIGSRRRVKGLYDHFALSPFATCSVCRFWQLRQRRSVFRSARSSSLIEDLQLQRQVRARFWNRPM